MGDTNVVKLPSEREGLKTGNAWAIQMLLSCFSEWERLKTGNFSISVLLWSGHVNLWPRPFHVYSQTLITC